MEMEGTEREPTEDEVRERMQKEFDELTEAKGVWLAVRAGNQEIMCGRLKQIPSSAELPPDPPPDVLWLTHHFRLIELHMPLQPGPGMDMPILSPTVVRRAFTSRLDMPLPVRDWTWFAMMDIQDGIRGYLMARYGRPLETGRRMQAPLITPATVMPGPGPRFKP